MSLPQRSALLLPTILVAFAAALETDDVDFVRDVRPILESRCYACHGPDKQKAGLRFDLREAALGGSGMGKTPVIVPGDRTASLILERLAPEFEEDLMPPEGEPLSTAEIELIARWIDAGAVWPEEAGSGAWKHWAYLPPVSPIARKVAGEDHPIDELVRARLATEGFDFAAEAERGVLLRRLSLDLIGLPPTLEELEAFETDDRPNAYERQVARLLASPHYGEQWARLWLDLGRYADTKGFEADRRRDMWRWRDWVIDAFNANMPFDEFTELQLAGDLLPDAQPESILATAFHRNSMTNDEGGTDDEEFRVAAVVDRVNTTMSVWMGTTAGCAQCHDHKYDPLTQKEYYELFAFFNQTEDADRNDDEPKLAVPSAEERAGLEEIAAQRKALEAELLAPDPIHDGAQAQWESEQREALAHMRALDLEWSEWEYSGPHPLDGSEGAGSVGDLVWTARPDYADGVVHTDFRGNNTAHHLRRTVTAEAHGALTLSLGSDDTLAVWVNGDLLLERDVQRGAAPDQDRVVAELAPGPNTVRLKITNGGGPSGFYFAVRELDLPDEVTAALASERLDAAQEALLRSHYRGVAPELDDLRNEIAALDARANSLRSPPIPVMRELPPDKRRRTFVHQRGSFLSPGEEVFPAVPTAFGELPEDAPRNRLGFARWLVSGDNPLTARVSANRYWEQLFGIGLVETTEDFGTQGERPSHPELLDWLALELVRLDWDVKAFLTRIVTSRTYKQSAGASPRLLERDRYNRLLARGPRFRLPAEAIRDQALFLAGLLSGELHGPPVMPPQPDGLWQVVYSGDTWTTSQGEDRYRRGLYTFWRRTTPYPSMLTFDAPSREICTERRVRTNTPLQALVTLNDPVYVEAAQALARRIVREGGNETRARVEWAFRLCTARRAEVDEIERTVALFESEKTHFATRLEAARALATEPLGPLPEGADPVELAAWTVVANVLLNLDEVLTKG